MNTRKSEKFRKVKSRRRHTDRRGLHKINVVISYVIDIFIFIFLKKSRDAVVRHLVHGIRY